MEVKTKKEFSKSMVLTLWNLSQKIKAFLLLKLQK